MSKRVRHASEPSSVQSTLGAFFESGENSKKRKRNDDSDDESVKSASPVKSKKHRSTFYKAWESKYQWLTYEEEEGMFCTLCIKFKQQAKNTEVWTKVGCKSYREDVIRNHERTSYHQVSVNMERDSLISKTTGGIGQALDTVVTLERRAFIAALRCETIREDVVAKVGQSSFYSILIDETTDISVLKQLIIYVKFMVGEECQIKFLAMEDLYDGKAVTITDKLKEVCKDANLQIKDKLIAFGSDGASVMVGRKGGVAALLKQESSLLISNHCVAHRLALAVRQAADNIQEIKKFNVHLDALFKFYDNSPVRMAALKNIQTISDNPTLKLKQPKAMRWLSHDKACDTLRQILPSVMMSLEREANERHDSLAFGLAKNVQTVQFITVLYSMCDLLPQLSMLSKCFQESGLDYSTIQEQVQITLDFLDSRLSIPGRYFKESETMISTLEENGFSITRRGISDVDEFKRKVHDKFIIALSDNIKNRFPDAGLISTFSCFDPSAMKNLDTYDLDFYAEEKIQTLAAHFSQLMDEETVFQEFNSFKMVIHKNKDKTTQFILQILMTKYRQLYPNLARLAEICMLIPASTADCERGFSVLNRVKTRARNRLSQKVLNNLMMVSTQGPEGKDFNFNRAAELWASLSQRKLDIGIINDDV
ncbi:zinc finger protein 862-like [Mytilus edulis]|uniref:zinc finger protein 862-like n=1 Tax=Mytilus edulis TaxID=6550 RepID=UPI0039F0DD31